MNAKTMRERKVEEILSDREDLKCRMATGDFKKRGGEVGNIKQNEHNSDTFHLDSSVNLP